MTPMLHLPYSPDLAKHDVLFLFPQMKKCPQRETFGQYGKGKKKKIAEALEGIKTDNLKNCFEQ